MKATKINKEEKKNPENNKRVLKLALNRTANNREVYAQFKLKESSM